MISITSDKNPRIQLVLRLREKSRERKERKLFVIEGMREVQLAIKGRVTIKEIFFCSQFIEPEAFDDLQKKAGSVEWVEIGRNVYEKIALRDSTEGVIAVAEIHGLELERIVLSDNPLVLVVESVEKPGNLGAILRTADAAAIDAILVCDPNIDLYNPNVIRSSLGCLFTQQLVVCESHEAIAWLQKNQIKIYGATPEGAAVYHTANLKQKCAVAVGSEAKGLSQIWLKNSDFNIAIPMRGEIDSLNVSVSAAIILFEAIRQRSKN